MRNSLARFASLPLIIMLFSCDLSEQSDDASRDARRFVDAGPTFDAGQSDVVQTADSAFPDAAQDFCSSRRGPAGRNPIGPCIGYDLSYVVFGNYSVSSAINHNEFACVRCVTGDLNIVATDLTNLSFDSLQKVSGSILVFDNNALTALAFPALASVGSDLSIGWRDFVYLHINPVLEAVSLPTLTAIGRDFVTQGNDALSEIYLPSLSSVLGRIQITQNGSLASVLMPMLSSAGSIDVGGSVCVHLMGCVDGCNGPITSLDFSNLTTVVGDLVVSCTYSTEVSLTSLIRIGNSLNFGRQQGPNSYIVSGNYRLSMVNAPLLFMVGDEFSFWGNPVLHNLRFPLLDMVGGSFSIGANSSYPNCEALALRDQVQSAQGIGGSIVIIDNHNPCEFDPCTSGTCAEDCSNGDFYVCQ